MYSIFNIFWILYSWYLIGIWLLIESDFETVIKYFKLNLCKFYAIISRKYFCRTLNYYI